MPYINAIDDNRNDEPGLFWLPLSGWRCVSDDDDDDDNDDDDASVTHMSVAYECQCEYS